MFKLPSVAVEHSNAFSRSVHDGYQRGWGLQFGHIANDIAKDPLFRKAIQAGEWSVMSEAKRMNLFLILTRFLPRLEHHDIVEFGSYKGGNALFMATLMKKVNPQARVYALDTFAGMPETDRTRDAHSGGDFGDASFDALVRRRDQLGLSNLVLVKGLFDQTFPSLSGRRFGLAHIDCDIYSSVRYAQNAVWGQMTAGGYLVYDDADVSSCLGATEAAHEMVMDRRIHAEQVWPHWIFRAAEMTG